MEAERTFTYMLNAFYTHIIRGNPLTVTNWHCIHLEDFSLRQEGLLISPRIRDIIHSYPCGTYQCGQCHNTTVMDTNHFVYFDEEEGVLLCNHCIQPPLNTNRIIAPVQYECKNNIPPSDLYTYEDRRPKTREARMEKDAYYDRVCKKVADLNIYIYLSGKTMRDIFLERITKRAWRRWRMAVFKRNTARLYQVLVRNCAIGNDAAMAISKKMYKPYLS